MGDHKKGFTLVELLVVVTILGILMALIIPAVGAARASARNAQCQNNMRNIAQAMLQHTTSKDRFPRLADNVGSIPTSWVADVMKVVRPDIYDQWLSNQSVTGLQVDVLLCPADVRTSGGEEAINYCYNAGRQDINNSPHPLDHAANGIGHIEPKTLYTGDTRPGVMLTLDYIAKHDGTAMTILVGENVDATWWTATGANVPLASAIHWKANESVTLYNINENIDGRNKNSHAAADFAYMRPSSRHSGTVNFAFCDGSVRTLSETIAPNVYARLMAPHDKGVKTPGSQTSEASTLGWDTTVLSESDLE